MTEVVDVPRRLNPTDPSTKEDDVDNLDALGPPVGRATINQRGTSGHASTERTFT